MPIRSIALTRPVDGANNFIIAGAFMREDLIQKQDCSGKCNKRKSDWNRLKQN